MHYKPGQPVNTFQLTLNNYLVNCSRAMNQSIVTVLMMRQCIHMLIKNGSHFHLPKEGMFKDSLGHGDKYEVTLNSLQIVNYL